MPLRPDEPISDSELERFLAGYGAKIVLYSDLKNYADLPALFSNAPYHFVVLFVGRPEGGVGHWTVMLRRGDYEYEFFDSLGYDDPDGAAEALGDFSRSMGDLISRSGHAKVIHGPQLQQFGTNTCARWCILRIQWMKMSLTDFHKTMRAIRRVWRDLDLFAIASTAIAADTE